MKYQHKDAIIDAVLFKPAPDPDPGEEREPEMEGVERVIPLDPAGSPRGVLYLVNVGNVKTGIRAGQYLAKTATGKWMVLEAKELSDNYEPYTGDAELAAAEQEIAELKMDLAAAKPSAPSSLH